MSHASSFLCPGGKEDPDSPLPLREGPTEAADLASPPASVVRARRDSKPRRARRREEPRQLPASWADARDIRPPRQPGVRPRPLTTRAAYWKRGRLVGDSDVVHPSTEAVPQ